MGIQDYLKNNFVSPATVVRFFKNPCRPEDDADDEDYSPPPTGRSSNSLVKTSEDATNNAAATTSRSLALVDTTLMWHTFQIHNPNTMENFGDYQRTFVDFIFDKLLRKELCAVARAARAKSDTSVAAVDDDYARAEKIFDIALVFDNEVARPFQKWSECISRHFSIERDKLRSSEARYFPINGDLFSAQLAACISERAESGESWTRHVRCSKYEAPRDADDFIFKFAKREQHRVGVQCLLVKDSRDASSTKQVWARAITIYTLDSDFVSFFPDASSCAVLRLNTCSLAATPNVFLSNFEPSSESPYFKLWREQGGSQSLFSAEILFALVAMFSPNDYFKMSSLLNTTAFVDFVVYCKQSDTNCHAAAQGVPPPPSEFYSVYTTFALFKIIAEQEHYVFSSLVSNILRWLVVVVAHEGRLGMRKVCSNRTSNSSSPVSSARELIAFCKPFFAALLRPEFLSAQDTFKTLLNASAKDGQSIEVVVLAPHRSVTEFFLSPHHTPPGSSSCDDLQYLGRLLALSSCMFFAKLFQIWDTDFAPSVADGGAERSRHFFSLCLLLFSKIFKQPQEQFEEFLDDLLLLLARFTKPGPSVDVKVNV
jgi:hypothetical protein